MTPIECDALSAILGYLEQDQERNPDHWDEDGYETYSALRKLKELLPKLKAWTERPEQEKADALEAVSDEALKDLLRCLS